MKRFENLVGRFYALFFLTCIGLTGCGVYSFTGASISPDIKTVSIAEIPNQTANGSAGISQKFTERLKDKFVTETNLDLVNQDADIEFTGFISGYEISSKAPTGQQTTALNRLNITVKIDYLNNKKPADGWSQSFSRFADYESDQNLSSIEDELIEEINEQLVEDIFNKALVNW